jgi:hypothetical protein
MASVLPPDSREAAVVTKLHEIREGLLNTLEQCYPDDEQYPTAAITKAIDRCSNTIYELEARRASFSDLKLFRIKVTIPTTPTKCPAQIVLRLDQMRTSKPLEVNDYIVIKPPTGPPFTAPRAASRECWYNYTHSFEIPDRSPRSIALTKAADVEFTIWRYTAHFEIEIGKGKVHLLALAKAPLLPLCFAATSSTQLEFKTPDGEKTYYRFETTMTTPDPIVPGTKDLLEDQVYLIKQ